MRNLFFALFITTICMGQDSITSISYYRLGEFAKYVAYKDSTVNIFTQFRNEARIKDSIIAVKEEKINELTGFTIPILKEIILKSDKELLTNKNLLNISAVELKNQKSKKWTWLGAGAFAGIIFTLLFGG